LGNLKLITAINAGKNTRFKRSNIFLDGKFAFSLDNEVIAKETLSVGRELSQGEITALAGADIFQRCLNAAFHFLSYRPRSESEIKERLERQGFDIENIERVLSHLKRLELVDDTAFAKFWQENRDSFRPRSQRMVKLELRRKGISTEVIDEAVEGIDDTENAYRAAVAKARTLPLADYRVFCQRLGSYLQRRGFNYGVINKIVKQVWHEKTMENNPSSDINHPIMEN
jgi:regulatory protein